MKESETRGNQAQKIDFQKALNQMKQMSKPISDIEDLD